MIMIKRQRPLIMKLLLRSLITFKTSFVDHYFHADPHPGNILIHELRPDESAKQYATTKHHEKTIYNTTISYDQQEALPNYRIIYLDFGMMGRLSPAMANSIANIVITINTKDTRKIGKAVLKCL